MAETTINSPGNSPGLSAGGDATVTTTTTSATGGRRSTADMLKAGREQAFQEAKTRVRDAADQQRGRAAEAVTGVAGALHRAASDMREENETMGRYTDMAAERLDEVANYLRDADWTEVIHGAEDFARRQPYWFVGGAMAAGFLLARFVKNSGESQRWESGATSMSQRLAASSGAGYGTSTEAGTYPPTTATTAPISSAPTGTTTTTTTSGSPSSPYSGEV